MQLTCVPLWPQQGESDSLNRDMLVHAISRRCPICPGTTLSTEEPFSTRGCLPGSSFGRGWSCQSHAPGCDESQTSTPRKLFACVQGAKVSVLAAGLDPRVSALCLIDPVDNTAWAPLGPGFPSAVQALREFGSKKVSILGSAEQVLVDACSLLGTGSSPPSTLQAVANPQIVPLAVVGSSLGGDCAPKNANYR